MAAEDEAAQFSSERCLTALVDAAARGSVEVDSAAYLAFRANVDDLARRIPDRLPDEEKFALIRAIGQEFESYRNNAEEALRQRMASWRNASTLLFGELIRQLGIDPASPKTAPLLQQLKQAATTDEIHDWHSSLEAFLHPLSGTSPAEEMAARLRTADCSTANDNAAGLRGGGAAVKHLRQIMDRHEDGFIVLFRLSCLEIVIQRFGPEAVEDCLMAVSAYLTAGLENTDTIYHWSDSALLAILQGRSNELILTAELERILAQNRESAIRIAGRSVMLRIPISFQITPVNRLHSPDDLLRISAHRADTR
ncbi:MAG: diguanylate cyclase [Terracidiphilus sp.]|nr:diguanylate cyclase [Terracidiphilus sp.]